MTNRYNQKKTLLLGASE